MRDCVAEVTRCKQMCQRDIPNIICIVSHHTLVSIYFSLNTKMCSGTTDCNGLSSTYSYVHHGTRMTVSFMFC